VSRGGFQTLHAAREQFGCTIAITQGRLRQLATLVNELEAAEISAKFGDLSLASAI